MKNEENIKRLLELLDKINVETENEENINDIRELLNVGDVKSALKKLEELKN